MLAPKLCVVIHAEEEFDWDQGFYRKNTQVKHGKQLIVMIETMLNAGAKVTLAMDYPFVTSFDGIEVINYFKGQQGENIEFATHLHPWVNPPFDHERDNVTNYESFPGNLDEQSERNKLSLLTEAIEAQAGIRPVSYLAGRYGIGANTQAILKELGYRIDLSISAYSNFSHIEGPNFTGFSNKIYRQAGLTYLPHTCSLISISRVVEDYLNRSPTAIAKTQENNAYSLLSKLLRIKKYRLSPEGFSFAHMKTLTEAQLRIGQQEFVLSFHSPSVIVGGTPYIDSAQSLIEFKNSLLAYIDWFCSLSNSSTFLPQSISNRHDG